MGWIRKENLYLTPPLFINIAYNSSMTDDSLNTPSEPPQKRPVKKTGKGASVKKTGSKSALKLPPFLAKIPLPYLGGGAAAIVMVMFVVIKAAMTPLPGEIQPQPAVPQQQEQPQPDATAPTTQQPTAAPTGQSVPVTQTAPESTVPVYGGPTELTAPGGESGLPLISPYGQTYAELGRRVRMDLAGFEAATTLYEIPDIGSDTGLGYGMRLPKEWVSVGQGPIGVGTGVSDILASYVSPPVAGNRQSFKVEVQKIPFAMQIRDFMALRAKSDLITYQAMSVYGTNRAEALYVVTESNVSYMVRMVAILSGDRVLTADYRVPVDQYDAEQDLQTWAITRFYVVEGNDIGAEETKSADFLDLGSFQYPASWRVQATDIQTLERMRISVANLPSSDNMGTEEVLKGQIDVMLFARDQANSEARMIDTMNGLVSAQGVHLGEPIGWFEAKIPLKMEKIFARVYPLIDKNGTEQTYQYWLLEIKGLKQFFMVGLFSPTRDQDLTLWTQNYAAFRTVIETIKEAD